MESKSFILDLFDDFIRNLESEGHLDVICTFIRLVAEGSFPLDNISSLLFPDVVRFYGIDNVSGLRYDSESKNTLLFWIYGQWLMHGKFTRFMTGGKFTGAVTCGKIRPGNFAPGGGTRINFAVPSDATIKRERESKELVVLPSHLEPGFLPWLVDQFTKEMKSVYVEKLAEQFLLG